jgi:hypothetical protein
LTSLSPEQLKKRLDELNKDELARLDGLLFTEESEDEGAPDDWEGWLARLFPTYTSRGFSEYHAEFWEWVWGVEKGKRPQPFVAIWPRGGGKSTSAELACVAWAARGVRKYVLYICETQEQADDHVSNVATMLESDSIARRYSDLGKPLVGKYGNSRGWRRNRLRTASGFTVDALGLDSAARGVKLDEQRPDAELFDDIDSETDSKEATAKKVKIITRKLLPAGSDDLGSLFLQNLVHKDSVVAQMADGRADFAADRRVSGPTPALRGFDYEKEGARVVITAGEPTWAGLPRARCQEMIDDMGLTAFLAECQHRVDIISGEKSFREYDEIFHVITWSEFADFFGAIARDANGQPRIPALWKKERGLDWGTTPEHPSACVFSTRPGKADPLSDCVFTFGEIVRPKWPPSDPHAVPELVSPGRVAQAIKDFQRRHMIRDDEIKGVMSHEASAALNTFLVDLPEEQRVFFSKWKARKGSGVPQIQEVLAIDRSKPHPFRKDPRTRQAIMGRPRHYIVVADGQGELYYDGEGNLKVRQPVDEAGLARLRAEIPEFDERATGAAKIFDDACDGWRGEAAGFFVAAAEPSKQQQRERKLAPELQKSAVIQIEDPHLRDHAEHSRRIHLQRMENEEKNKERASSRFALPKVRFRK